MHRSATYLLLTLATLLTGIGLSIPDRADKDVVGYSGGWAHHRVTSEPYGEDFPAEWVGDGVGLTRLLYRDYEAVTGRRYAPRNQTDAPSCVGHSVAAGVDFLAVSEIASGQFERYAGGADASTIYGLSRHEIAHTGRGADIMLFQGSTCEWACQALQEYGVLIMRDYPLLGIDLSTESADRDRQYGRSGCPDQLEAIARLHPVRGVVRITTYEQVRDAIANGCPVVVGSQQGFGESFPLTRDSQGFLVPPRWGPGSRWYHAMVIIGFKDTGRAGALFLNSWGDDWVDGPPPFADAPEGTFLVDKEVVTRMVAEGDSYALYGFVGFPVYRIW